MKPDDERVLWICIAAECFLTWVGPSSWRPICNDHLKPMFFVNDPVIEAELILKENQHG